MTWIFITRLGGIYVTLPAGTAIAVWLCAARAWRMVFSWCVIVTAVLALTIGTKIAFIGWGLGIPALDFTGISGHSARATLIFPVLFYLFLQKATPRSRMLGVSAGLLLGMLIGVSRLTLHAHSMSEVLAGCAIGGGASAIFLFGFEQPRRFAFDHALISATFIVLAAATFLKPAPTQRWMIASALYFSGHDRPYIRQGWRLAPPSWNRHLSRPQNLSEHAAAKL